MKLQHEPLLIAGIIGTITLTALDAWTQHPTPLGWASALLPVILAAIGRVTTVPWAKVAPLVDQAAEAAGQVYPDRKAWAQLLQSSVNAAAAHVARTGFPVPIETPPDKAPDKAPYK